MVVQALQINNQAAQQNQPNPPSHWSDKAIANTALKAAALAAAAIFFLGNQTPEPGSFVESTLNYMKENAEMLSKAWIGIAFAPELFIAGKFVTCDYPVIGGSIVGAVIGIYAQKHKPIM
ncbi:MAG TPA: hypothetical protein VLE96_01245 [Chlamydiales bacterium]|nr:hypothetical protein [Chlamydiales bacterium]